MTIKFLLLVISAVVFQGHCVTQISLPDQTINYISNPITGASMTIPKWALDTQMSCHIIFPYGNTYEAYPNSNIPYVPKIQYMHAVPPFNSCAVGFRDVTEDFAGTYELLSMVNHTSTDYSVTLTRQKFILNIRMTEVEFP